MADINSSCVNLPWFTLWHFILYFVLCHHYIILINDHSNTLTNVLSFIASNGSSPFQLFKNVLVVFRLPECAPIRILRWPI